MRTYLFDLDGTLLDSIDLILTTFHHTSRVHLGLEFSDSHWLEGMGTPLRDQLGRVARSKEELAAMLDTYVTYNLSHHDAKAKPYPGVVEAVRRLDQMGAPLGLVTSKMRAGTERGLRLLGLEEEFRVRICADDVVHGKPHPEPVLMALRALGASPEDALFIGDSLHDIEAGKRAGVTTVAVAWGPFPREALEAGEPDHWLEEPGHVLDL